MKSVYAEIGYGNDGFLSTEVEDGEFEYRVRGFIKPEIIEGYYVRIWIGKRVFVISTNRGVGMHTKNRNNFKILFGIGGTSTNPPASVM
ncbi:MAG: DUF3977 family protein [Patescibacteria group bacterium]